MFSGKPRNLRSILIKETTMRLAPLAFILFTLIWFLAEASERSQANTTTTSTAAKETKAKIPLCQDRPDFLTESKIEIKGGIAALPQALLVAKEAKYFIENKKAGSRVVSAEDFSARESKILCASLVDQAHLTYSIAAPVLMDLSGNNRVQTSYWQFRISANTEKVGIWNQRIRFGRPDKSYSTRVFEIGNDQVEVQRTRETENSIEVLSIKYRVMSGIN